MKIAILGGAGLMGAGVARDLLSDRAIIDIACLRICDNSPARMHKLQSELADPRVELFELDVTRADALARALDGVDLCINSVPTLAGFQMAIFEAALAARIPYVDLGGLGTYTVKQLAEHERFQQAGVTAVIGVGADPGMSNVICRAVADELDQIERINLYWAATLIGAENPVLCPPYSVSTVLAEYAHPSTQFLGGKHVQCEPLAGHEFLDLPEPWGRCDFMYSPHSEQLTVPLAEGIKEKGIQEFTWKLHLPSREHEAWVGLVKAGFNDFEDPLTVGGVTIKPVDFLSALIQRNMERNAHRIPAQESHEIHLAIGHGLKDGKRAVVRCEVIVKPDPMYQGYVDACTSMNASIAAQLILSRPRKAGVFAPESYFDIPSYFIELGKRHFSVRTSVEF
ncbi:MAG: saccharopine dehydrogenase NADP-binding domain-containing protein [Betaproteobacteria bacterium]